MIDAYGSAACRSAISAYASGDFSSKVRSVKGPGTWAFTAGGRSQPIESVYTLAVLRTRNGQHSTKTIHLALVAGEFRWFSSC